MLSGSSNQMLNAYAFQAAELMHFN